MTQTQRRWLIPLLSIHCRYNRDAKQKRELRTQALVAWDEVTCAQMAAV